MGGGARPAWVRQGRTWTSAQTAAPLLQETEAEERPGTPPLGLPAAPRRPPSPCPRRSRDARPEAAGGTPRAALTWLAAGGAGGQQGPAQAQPRRHEQQPPRPHCPGRARGALGAGAAAGGWSCALALLPPGQPREGRPSAERSPRGEEEARVARGSRGGSGAQGGRGARRGGAGAGAELRAREGRPPAPGVRLGAVVWPASHGSLPSCRAAPGLGDPEPYDARPASPVPPSPPRPPATARRGEPDETLFPRGAFGSPAVSDSACGGLGRGPRGPGGRLWSLLTLPAAPPPPPPGVSGTRPRAPPLSPVQSLGPQAERCAV